MLGLDSPPTRIDLPEHTASCLSPDGRWLAMIGRNFDVTLYDLDSPGVPRRLACRQDDRTPVDLTMAGSPEDGLLAIVHVHDSEDHKPRAEQRGARLELRALPGGERVELGPVVEDLPDDWFDTVDALHAPHGFDAPTLVLSTAHGGTRLQRDGGQLVASTARTRGKLLTAHPVGGLVVSTQFGASIETPDGPVQSLGHTRAPSHERFVFGPDGRTAVWLRDRLLTALRIDDASGWTAVATHDVPDDREALDLGSRTLLWRRTDDGRVGVWCWDHPFDDLHEAGLDGTFELASVSPVGDAVLALEPDAGRMVVARPCANPSTAQGMHLPATYFGPRGPNASTFAPDGRHAVVVIGHAEPTFEEDSHHCVSYLVWDLELHRSTRVLVDHEVVRDSRARFSPGGALAVMLDDRVAFWRPGDGGLEPAGEASIAALDLADRVLHWMAPDILAVTSPHSDLALLFDDQGHPRTPDHFGPWGFQIPQVGRYSATGRRTHDLYGTTRLTAAVGRMGQVTVELQASTWEGAERGTQTTMLAYHQGPGGLEVSAVELPHATRMIFGNLAVLDRGGYVIVPIFGPIRSCRVYRVDESPLKLEHVALLEHIQAFAATPDHPWLFTLPTGDDPVLEIRHANDPTTVVERIPLPPGATWLETHADGRLLQVASQDGRWQWRLELD